MWAEGLQRSLKKIYREQAYEKMLIITYLGNTNQNIITLDLVEYQARSDFWLQSQE